MAGLPEAVGAYSPGRAFRHRLFQLYFFNGLRFANRPPLLFIGIKETASICIVCKSFQLHILGLPLSKKKLHVIGEENE